MNEPRLDPKWKRQLDGNEVVLVGEASTRKENLTSLAQKEDLVGCSKGEPHLLSKWVGGGVGAAEAGGAFDSQNNNGRNPNFLFTGAAKTERERDRRRQQ